MWQFLAKFVIKNRLVLLILFFAATALMGYYASQVKLSYEFAKAIPANNPKYLEYLAFKDKFGDDGNMVVIGVTTPNFFSIKNFTAYQQFEKKLSIIKGVESTLSVPAAVTLQKNLLTEKLQSVKIFPAQVNDQAQLDSLAASFYNLPFYRSLLYNPATNAYLMGARINKDILNSTKRAAVIKEIKAATLAYENNTGIQTHLSGLPLIRTEITERVKTEMRFFLVGSLILSVIILLLFFRSISTTLLSLAVVICGVVWAMGITYLFGYSITLLTALLPSLIVVIGIPNCIYFINKYHTAYLEKKDKEQALIDMVSKMGIVTLFCNITAAIGFAVFAFTKSAILKEFGVVAGLGIMVIFFISFILLPSVLSLLRPPRPVELKYLHSKWVTVFLDRVVTWVFNYRKSVLAITLVLVLLAVAGMARLQNVAFIVDDLPKKDKIYTDLTFFEKNFKGIMPLEIVVHAKKNAGFRSLAAFEKIDSLSQYIGARKEMSRPLSLAEGLKFAKQGFYEMDSTQYLVPNSFDGAFVSDYLKPSRDTAIGNNSFNTIMRAFIDSSKRNARISISMADVGTKKLPSILNDIQVKADALFDSSAYTVSLTGTSITFLEGSRFIIEGLKESILWAFLLIAICMLYLFRSFKILICSLVPNVIPLLITAGIMGWVGLPLKPSTVLIFSVALGIAVDITIRFLVNYKQELPLHKNDVAATVKATIKSTGLSIVYTALVLTAGFIIFCGSRFGGTVALGWLTSVTLLTATFTNLILLPILILLTAPKKRIAPD